jgi:hypothetical protein
LLYSFKIEVEVELKILMFEGVVYFDWNLLIYLQLLLKINIPNVNSLKIV